MTSDVIAKIDLLIEMSKSTSNYDTLKAELDEISVEIETKRKELEELKSSMQDEKYIKASDRIIDENIKVSLELKIQNMEKSRKKQEKELSTILNKETKLHKTVQNLKSKVSKLTSMLNSLNEKNNSLSQDIEAKDYYQRLIEENEKKLEQTKKDLNSKEEEYTSISEKMDDLTKQLEELKKKIESEKSKLTSTVENLQSNESYLDKSLKEEDEKKVQNLEKRLKNLALRKEEIQNDAVMIGNEAKELLIEDDRTGSLLKLRELVEYIQKMPYMDITNRSDVERILNETLENANLERDEFASFIENKKYDQNNSEIILERQKYLERKKQEYQEELNSIRNKIKKIDMTYVREVNSLLSAASVVQETLKKELAEYQKVLETDNESSPKKKATLIAAFNKKEEEQNMVEEIICDYETEIEDLILESKRMEEEDIKKMEAKISNIDNTLKEIEKKVMIRSKAKDVLALENDKAKLKELTENVKRIQELQKYPQTPSEIYDEIEMMLGSTNDLTKEPTVSNPILERVEEPQGDWVNNFRITQDIDDSEYTRTEQNKPMNEQEIIDEKESFNETLHMPWENMEQPKVEEVTLLNPEEIAPVVDVEPVSVEELFKQPTLKEEPVSERFKVIDIESLDTQEDQKEPTIPKEPSKEDVLISDFKDDDYIDFDSIIGG